jgi:hypothetical protein
VAASQGRRGVWADALGGAPLAAKSGDDVGGLRLDDHYVRSGRSGTAAGFRAAQARRKGAVSVAGVAKGVVFVTAGEQGVTARSTSLTAASTGVLASSPRW